ncbi:protein LDOC1-like [Dendrobates tinctorius]|uniref:protein LDOC1-like n=1 Tax=Dendrobates tinctorius TaxID=92724 RepID=UPI003CC96999
MHPARPQILPVQTMYQELCRQKDAQEELSIQLKSITTKLEALNISPEFLHVEAAVSSPETSQTVCLLRDPGPLLAAPPCFDGNPKLCCGFINQCRLHFQLRLYHFLLDRAKVAFLISHLVGGALAWLNPLWEREDLILSNLPAFLEASHKVLDELM